MAAVVHHHRHKGPYQSVDQVIKDAIDYKVIRGKRMDSRIIDDVAVLASSVTVSKKKDPKKLATGSYYLEA